MQRSRTAWSLAIVLLVAAALPARSAEVTLINDSTLNGTPSSVANFFIPGEEVGSWFTSTCDGDIVAAQLYWTSQFGGNPDSLETALRFYDGGVFPTPGLVLVNQGPVAAVIPGPTLADMTINEFRFLDPPTDAVPVSIPVTVGQTFVVSLEFLNQSNGNPFASAPGFDQNGCQNGLNGAKTIPGGWADSCLLGVTGDWVIRAVVDCDAPTVPATPAWPLSALGLLLPIIGAVALARRRS